ncbi:MAG: 16S rRNA (cytosine(967)-C(5))-methyltransferase RsmB [Ruminococcaceae bacterium]|nr:16S rRNA (cytosine(967)-C(5))-methyltransferase RsmB [Oscillospiraceae bacterium]
MATAREIALQELLRLEAAGQYADRTLNAALNRATALSSADRGFLSHLFYGVIERRITLDAVIDSRSSIAPSAIEKRVRMILRMGLYQLCYMDRVPDHAAINEAVALAPRRSKGFVNAILRGFCRDGKRIPLPDAAAEPIRYLSVAYSVSPSVAECFLRIFGPARAAEVLAAFGQHPPITVRVNTLRLTRAEFLQRVEGAAPTELAPFGAILPEGAPLQELIREGVCFVQDEASQLAVAALAAAPGMRVLDLCAAPGSKSFGAALSMENAGTLHSFDLHENKLSLVREGASRLGITNMTVAAADARTADPAVLGVFDRVICDVPCSGLGVIGKKPDIRYKNMDEAAGLVPVQRDILAAAAGCVAPDGVLLYSTCTLLPEENEEQVQAFLATHTDFAPVPFAVGDLTVPAGMLTLAPDTHRTDGFFIAVLRRK